MAKRMMEYDFIRNIVKEVSETDAQEIYRTLTENGIEVFVKKDDVYHNVTIDMILENADLYVSAADLEHARNIVREIGLEQYLCIEAEVNANVQKSEVEMAEEEFYRKHKQNQLFVWVIIAGVVVFMVLQFFVK